mmetsp:Transcript_67517/g.159179  ORF Transcript_67517/g.159179 Transcript_67517/m.159179 type:complete len:222 (+) Transcript_67517:152-817(+)
MAPGGRINGCCAAPDASNWLVSIPKSWSAARSMSCSSRPWSSSASDSGGRRSMNGAPGNVLAGTCGCPVAGAGCALCMCPTTSLGPSSSLSSCPWGKRTSGRCCQRRCCSITGGRVPMEPARPNRLKSSRAARSMSCNSRPTCVCDGCKRSPPTGSASGSGVSSLSSCGKIGPSLCRGLVSSCGMAPANTGTVAVVTGTLWPCGCTMLCSTGGCAAASSLC